MGSIYKRMWTNKETGEKVKGDTFWISYYRDGKQVRESAGTSSLGEAKRLLAEKESNISRGIPVNQRLERMKFSKLTMDVVKKLFKTWEKSKPEASRSQPEADPQPQSSPPQRRPAPQSKESIRIGSTITIKGSLVGEGDLLIEGRLNGKIEIRQHSITVGKRGQVKADIYGRIIIIEGAVEGNLYGEEKLIVRQSGTVRGNIVSPRVVLEDGSNFKGSIDMSPKENPSVQSR